MLTGDAVENPQRPLPKVLGGISRPEWGREPTETRGACRPAACADPVLGSRIDRRSKLPHQRDCSRPAGLAAAFSLRAMRCSSNGAEAGSIPGAPMTFAPGSVERGLGLSAHRFSATGPPGELLLAAFRRSPRPASICSAATAANIGSSMPGVNGSISAAKKALTGSRNRRSRISGGFCTKRSPSFSRIPAGRLAAASSASTVRLSRP